MRKPLLWCSLIALAFAVGVASNPSAFAENFKHLAAVLVGYNEPPSISTGASGEFVAQVSKDETEIEWQLSYSGLEGDIQQAHIHLGQAGVNGGISVFLCTNLGNGPAGIQGCPASPATISGTIRAADVSPNIPATQAARNQGLDTGEIAELIRAIRAGSTYVNVHSTRWPGGEIRSQIHVREANN